MAKNPTQTTIQREDREAIKFLQNPSLYLTSRSEGSIRLAKKGLERKGYTQTAAKVKTYRHKPSKPSKTKIKHKISKPKFKVDVSSTTNRKTIKIGNFKRKATIVNFTFDFTKSKSTKQIQFFSKPLIDIIMKKFKTLKLKFNNKTVIQLFTSTDFIDKNKVLQHRESNFRLVLTNSYSALKNQLQALFKTFEDIALKYKFLIQFMDLTIDYIQ